jgi:hypothetical protein
MPTPYDAVRQMDAKVCLTAEPETQQWTGFRASVEKVSAGKGVFHLHRLGKLDS